MVRNSWAAGVVRQGTTGDWRHGCHSAHNTAAAPAYAPDDNQQLDVNARHRRSDDYSTSSTSAKPRPAELQMAMRVWSSYDDGAWQHTRGSSHGEWGRHNC
jgi:hypothetical protein